MFLKLIATLMVPTLCSCAWNNQATGLPPAVSMLPTREESAGFLSRIHRKVRDSERATYNLMYGIRDGVDSFVYDVQKDYYDGYQK